MPKSRKHLTEPRRPTVKRLFAVSGNKCAFPGCPSPLVEPNNGSIIGVICHIKGDKVGSARYDENQLSDERQSFENLILMCSPHHKVIDDHPDEYPVELLIELKAKHEAGQPKVTKLTDTQVDQLVTDIADNPFRRLVSLGLQINEDEWTRKRVSPQRSISQEEYGKLERAFHKCGAECRMIARKLAGWNANEVKEAIENCNKALIGRFRRIADDPPREDLTTWSHRASNRFTAALVVIQQFADEYDAERQFSTAQRWAGS